MFIQISQQTEEQCNNHTREVLSLEQGYAFFALCLLCSDVHIQQSYDLSTIAGCDSLILKILYGNLKSWLLRKERKSPCSQHDPWIPRQTFSIPNMSAIFTLCFRLSKPS